MYEIEVRHFFDAAHQLQDTPELVTKGCANLHGHTYAVVIKAKTKKLNNAGMVIDFKAIKQAVDNLDHRYINDVFEEKNIDLPPTAENIAYVIYQWIKDLGVDVDSVSVCEGYKGVEKASWAVYQ